MVGEHRGWCAGYEHCRVTMAASIEAAFAAGRAEGLAAKSDGLTDAASSSNEEPDDEQMEVMDAAAPLRDSSLDVALNICSFLAPTHEAVLMQAERSL